MKRGAIVALAALTAFGLSLAYVKFCLRGGPRIIDATTYWLEARALSEGHLAWSAGDPEAATAGRFLVRDTLGSGAHLAAIFPPGWPAVLAIGFWLGAPLLVGPVIAALLVFATARLGRALAERMALPARDIASIEAAAATLSAVNACLRYHTADTMSHGLAALCFTSALLFALRVTGPSRLGSTGGRAIDIGALGFSLGLLIATRPVSGGAASIAVIWIGVAAHRARREALGPSLWPIARTVALGALAAAPPIALFIAHQHAATGAWLRSAQTLYYSAADGPPGCFRYGFGEGIGCRVEHAEFVHNNLSSGYNFIAVLHTTGLRLWVHAGDALNASWLFPITLASIAWAAATRALRVLALGVALVVVLYAPFYFDGSYPGGGARFYADTLPLELLAIVFFSRAMIAKASAARSVDPERWIAKLAFALPLLAVAGFFARGMREHALLRDRDGGAPMFDAAFVDRELVRRGVDGQGPEAPKPLVFVCTDHGFNLAYDPDSTGTFEVARCRGDALDRLAIRAHGARDVFRYRFDLETPRSVPTLEPYHPSEAAPIEAEGLIPSVSQDGGWVVDETREAASDGRALSLKRSSRDVARARLSLPRAVSGTTIRPTIFGGGALRVRVLEGEHRGEIVAEWARDACDDDAPLALDAKVVAAPLNTRIELEIETHCAAFAVDSLVLENR